MGFMNGFGNRGGGYQMGGPLSSGRMSIPGTGMGYDMHRIPIVGNMFDNPYDKFKQQQMQNAAQAYSMYRPEAMQGAMNAMNMQSTAMQPVNNALAAMYGSGATQGFQAQNPFGATAFTRGAASGTNPYMPGSGGGFGAPPAAQPPGAPPPQGRANVIGRTNGDLEARAGLSEDWRLGRQSESSQRHQDQVNATGGQYGASVRLEPYRSF